MEDPETVDFTMGRETPRTGKNPESNENTEGGT